nr:MAG TPA: hypothetical protein [Caudoviricetes sp.]
MNIEIIPTADLITELRKREGVETTVVEPYQDAAFSVNGPALVLVVTD